MSPISPRARALAAIVALILAALAGLSWTRPPAPVPASAPPGEFSAERALAHVRAIAQRPHRMGSPEHARVRGYLMDQLAALHLDPAVQEAIVTDHRRGEVIFARVDNVVARRRGTGGGKALLLVAHYDTRSMTPGASDDGFGVAALLETMRALSAGEPLARDVIVLFTDGEEEGLFGARAFASSHPFASEVGMVLNFEARGDAGPALMFQTSDDNGALIDALAAAVAQPAANSLSQDIYRRMPNDTDLTVWLSPSPDARARTGGARVPALNVANIGGFERYHAPTDTPDNLDPGTLQHHGMHALSLARAFASGPLPPPARPDAAYFDAGPVFVRYPGAWGVPLACGCGALLAIFLALGTRGDAVRIGRALLGLAITIGVAVAVAVAAGVLWALAEALHPAYALMNAARPLLKDLYLTAFVTLGAGVALVVQRALAPRVRAGELFGGAAALFSLLAVVTAVYLPGGAFLFTWPALLALALGIAVLFAGGFEASTPLAVALQVLAPLPAIVVIAPFITQLPSAFGPAAAPAPAALAALCALLAAPALRHLLDAFRRAPLAALAAAGALYVAAGVLPPFDRGHPRPDTLFFAVDADAGRAFWASPDRAPDDWTSNVLDHASWRQDVPISFPLDGGFLTSEVAKVAEPAPEIRWLPASGGGAVLVRVVAPPAAEVLAVRVDGPIASARVAGKPVSAGGEVALRFYAPRADGVEIELNPRGPGPITVRALSQRPGFPEGATPQPGARPPERMAKPGMLPPWDDLLESDMTIVARKASR
jgi:hypothetical protein